MKISRARTTNLLSNPRIPHNHSQQDSQVRRDVLFTSSPSLLLSSLPTQALCRKLQSSAEGKKLSLLQTKQLLKRPDAAVKGSNKSLTKLYSTNHSDIRELHTQM